MAVWLLPFEKVRRVSRCSKFVNVWARGGPIGKHNAKDMCEGRAVVTHKVFENEMNGNFGSNLTKCAREFDGRLSEQARSRQWVPSGEGGWGREVSALSGTRAGSRQQPPPQSSPLRYLPIFAATQGRAAGAT